MVLASLIGMVLGAALEWIADALPRWTGHVPRHAPGLRSRTAMAVSGLCGALGFALLWHAPRGAAEQGAHALGLLFFLLVALIDLKHRLVLNVLIYPAIVAAVVARAIWQPDALLPALVGGGMAFGIFFLTAQLKPGQLGGGDVKLAALIGLLLGFPGVLWALLAGTGAAGVVVAWLLVVRHAGMKAQLPYAPFLCFGALVTLLLAPALFTA